MTIALLAVLVALALVVFLPGAWCVMALVPWLAAITFYRHSGKIRR